MKKTIVLLLICLVNYSKEVEVFKSHSGLSDSVSLIKNSDSTQYGLASLSKLYTMLGRRSTLLPEQIAWVYGKSLT